MAKLLCIKTSKSLTEEYDIIGEFPDNHVFDQNEIDKFHIVDMPSKTKEDILLEKETLKSATIADEQNDYFKFRFKYDTKSQTIVDKVELKNEPIDIKAS